eukprot:13851000-Heterocapsa_arctica.AAC.1
MHPASRGRRRPLGGDPRPRTRSTLGTVSSPSWEDTDLYGVHRSAGGLRAGTPAPAKRREPVACPARPLHGPWPKERTNPGR